MTAIGDRVAWGRAQHLRGLVPGLGSQPTILIDGPSGAGKSSLAAAMHAVLPGSELVALDSIYPGWSGLAAAVDDVQRELLLPRRRGRAGGWRRWDWEADAAAEWNVVRSDIPLILEGCGALATSLELSRPGTMRIWLDADDDVRRDRALTRDNGAFDAHWDMWDRQWTALCRLHRPELSATVRFRSNAPQVVSPLGGYSS
ncbi:MAG: ATP-binding protein [Mycetocola sp.]